MGYYVRILSPSYRRIPYGELRAALGAEHPAATLSLEQGSEIHWEQLLLSHRDGPEIAIVQHNSIDEAVGSEEIEEFRAEIAACNPHSAAVWLNDYISRVRAIYAFQVLTGTDAPHGWEILGSLKTTIWRKAGGIFQADREGFSNEDGYHILWQFSDSTAGNWWMGVLENGSWVHFEMDLGNPRQREAFLAGEVPAGVARA